MLGIITALPQEAKCFKGGRYHLQTIKQVSNDVAIVVGGVNLHHAGAAAELLIKAGAKALVSFGTVGGLSPEIAPGMLCIPDTIVNENHQILAVDKLWRARLLKITAERFPVYTQSLLSVNQIIENPEAKDFLAQNFAARIVDMESAAIALIAKNNHIPFIVVRAVVEPRSFVFPPCILQSIKPSGAINYFNVMSLLSRRPQDLIACYKLQRYFNQARKTLKQIVKVSDLQLGWR